MERRIIEKYAELNKACEQYPIIELNRIMENFSLTRKKPKADRPSADFCQPVQRSPTPCPRRAGKLTSS